MRAQRSVISTSTAMILLFFPPRIVQSESTAGITALLAADESLQGDDRLCADVNCIDAAAGARMELFHVRG